MLRIIIVDDHAVVRAGLANIIEFDKNLSVIAQAGSAEEALRLLITHPCDVMILDISLPGRSGLDIIRDVTSMSPGTKIIILSMYKESMFAMRSYKAGASAYLTKESAPEQIISAIYKVNTGGRYISPDFASLILDDLMEPGAAPAHEQLSTREYEVMRLIANGRSLVEIASALSVSDRTVSTYRTRILKKMNLKSNADIIHYAIAHHLTD